jgi:hypothetical protein
LIVYKLKQEADMLELTYPNGFPVHVNPYAVVTITQVADNGATIVTTNGNLNVKEDIVIVSQRWTNLMSHYAGRA